MTPQRRWPTLGIIASELCRRPADDAHRWWHLRRYVAAYASVIGSHRVFATENTAEIVQACYAEAAHSRPSLPKLKLQSLGPTTRGVVKLAAMVARKEVRRVLWFQDPGDLLVARVENYALLRNCNLAGAQLLMNAAAHLWALYEMSFPRERESIGTATIPYHTDPYDEGEVQESVFLIAHDAEKPRMSRFAFQFSDVLARFPRLMATAGTLVHIAKSRSDYGNAAESLRIEPVGATPSMAHGPSGGDVIVADEIYDWYGRGGRAHHGQYVLHHVLFFADHRQSHPHEADIRVLLETCANPLHRVNLILNSRMAEEWAQRYRRPPSNLALQPTSRAKNRTRGSRLSAKR